MAPRLLQGLFIRDTNTAYREPEKRTPGDGKEHVGVVIFAKETSRDEPLECEDRRPTLWFINEVPSNTASDTPYHGMSQEM